MKKMLVFMMVMCCLLSGCASNEGAGNINVEDIDTGDIDTGDIDVGDIDTGDIDVGDIDTGDIDVGDIDTGIYIKTEADNIYSVEWQYNNQNGSYVLDSALETDVYILLTRDISEAAESEGESIDFTVTAKQENGEVFAEGNFTYEQGTGRMELTVGRDGTISE